jgi:redox-sensitive bicupin YhaK (pirin superfamily)
MAIERIIDKRIHDLGGGFEVGRLLPFAKRRMVGPYIFFDHMGPVELAPGIPRELDVRPHPHIGLSTVTYLYDGAMTHRDSLGVTQEIKPGEVNWMTSGSGVTHSERLEYARKNGALMHGIQAWVALPDGEEEVAPSFHHRDGADLPTWVEDGIKGRLIAGAAEGMRANVPVLSSQFYMHWEMEADAVRTLPADYPERAIYVTSGKIDVDGRTVTGGQLAVLEDGSSALDVRAVVPSTVMAFGGEPIGERFMLWNFVSSSKERLLQAKEDWKQGRMKLPDADHAEFIPFPEEREIV